VADDAQRSAAVDGRPTTNPTLAACRLRGKHGGGFAPAAALAGGRADAPSATILDSRTLQSTPESGARAGFDGHKKRKGSKPMPAVDTLGQRPGKSPRQHQGLPHPDEGVIKSGEVVPQTTEPLAVGSGDAQICDVVGIFDQPKPLRLF